MATPPIPDHLCAVGRSWKPPLEALVTRGVILPVELEQAEHVEGKPVSKSYLGATPILNYASPSIVALLTERGWNQLSEYERIGSAYDFVRNEIRFGYNRSDDITASQILADGYGQCNTKTTLLMTLLRGLGIPCRFHGFTIHKSLQRGVVPELIYPIAPRNILHSWVEVQLDGSWIKLEGFILDAAVLSSLQDAFPGRESLCAYGAGTDCLQSPKVEWKGDDTFIQKTGINQDFGVFDTPDAFYRVHKQLSGWRGFLYRNFIRHWMNNRVEHMRNGRIPHVPGVTGDTTEEIGFAQN